MRIFYFVLILFVVINCTKKDQFEPLVLRYIEFKDADTLSERNYIEVFDESSEKKATLSNSELKIVIKI